MVRLSGTPPPDTQPPSAPGALGATAVSSSQINLSWTASIDNVAVTGYLVERCLGAGCVDFAQIGTTTGLALSDTGRAANTPYSYRVRAIDAANNPSAYSNVASATTPPPDTQPPTVPGGLTATAVSASQINLAWSASTDNVAVTSYLIERCAGIDIGKRVLVCCVMTGAAHEEPRSETRRFDTTVPGLKRLRNWLNEERVTDVVMESTGSYWIPVFNLLEGHVTVVLANPEEVKNRKGHKTDRKDAGHLADLLRHNHVKSSYIPAEPVRQLRDLTRRRVQLTQDATRERNRVQKLLEQVNVKIGSVLTDVFGVSGLHMRLALLDGRAAPEEIAGLARGSAKRKTPQLIEAIEGNRMSDHVRFLIRGCLRHLACLEEEVEELDTEILRRMQLSTFQKAFTLLQTIPGVGQLSAANDLGRDRARPRLLSDH